ncbi:MAG: prolyl-tRNA synthetase associated domain-containing protein [Ruminococcaceae bacterium]|nr:prolyl-tRNA synthetase associated domain-containing protein [Oscillospiraceae bacterium]
MAEFYVDPVLYEGRPLEKRSELEEDCYDLLDKLQIKYERADHSAAHTIEDCAAVEDVIGVHICKNLLVCNRQQTDFYLVMMPGDKPFRTKDFSARLGISRVSFASPEAMKRLIRLTPGSVSIMGLQYDTERRVKLCIDEEILKGEYIRCHPNLNTSTLKIRTDDLMTRLLPYLGHKPTVITLPNAEENE